MEPRDARRRMRLPGGATAERGSACARSLDGDRTLRSTPSLEDVLVLGARAGFVSLRLERFAVDEPCVRALDRQLEHATVARAALQVRQRLVGLAGERVDATDMRIAERDRVEGRKRRSGAARLESIERVGLRLRRHGVGVDPEEPLVFAGKLLR